MTQSEAKTKSLRALAPRLLLLAAGVSAISLSFGAAPVMAQTAGASANTVGEVVVSASRRREKARDVPVAVTSISGQKLEILNSSGLDVRFLSARTPSLSIESSFGRTYPRFYIRGLGNTDFDINAQQPVSVVYDDVALENPLMKSFPVFDLQSVEVLRGPQGTLFGRNTPAGVVKLESARPTDHFTGYGSAAYGTFGTVNAEGAVSGPLGGGFSARLSAIVQKRDDWVTNTSATGLASKKLEGYEDKAVRFQLAYDNGPFKALFNVHGRSLDGTPRLFRAGLFKQGSNAFSNGFDIKKVSLDGYTSQDLSSEGTSLHLTYDFGGLGTLHSITSVESAKVESSGDIDGGNVYSVYPPLALGQALFPVSTGGTSKPAEISQELRFETAQFGKVRGQFGYYYFVQNLKYSELDFTTSGAKDGDVKHRDININYGVFASGEYAASDALTLRAGLRYSSDRKKDVIFGQGILTGVPLPVTTRVKGDNVSGDISATYVLSPTVNLYARLATGYQGPAIQDRVNFFSVPTVAKAQTSTSGETGIKTLLFEKKLRFDLAAFYYEVKDLQLTAVGGSSNSAKLLNAKKADGYGLEADLEARPVDALLLTAGGAWNHTEIKDGAIGVSPCGSGLCTVTDPVVGGLARINGNPLPQAPEWTANVTAKYTWPLARGSLYLYSDLAYRSEVNFFLYEAKEFTGKAKTELGLRLGYVTEGGLEFAGYVRNLTNQIVSESAIDFNNLTGMVSEPRTYGVAIRKTF